MACWRGPTDVLAAGVAVLGVEGLEAGAAVGTALLHDVTLAAQDRLTLETAEVLHVPMASFCLGALIRKDDLERRRGGGGGGGGGGGWGGVWGCGGGGGGGGGWGPWSDTRVFL